jgi:uncharacterized RDD family membrane protein YckC
MISGAMAVAAVGAVRFERAVYAREARLARVLALVTDTVIVAALTFVVNSVFGVDQITSGSPATASIGFNQFTSSTTVAWPWLTLLGVVYFTLTEAMFGASPGKLWVGLRVVRVDGQPLTLVGVIIRNLLKPIDWLPILYLLGGVSVLLTTNSQRLGDLAAGTTVVYRHRALEPGATRSSGRRARQVLATSLVAAAAFTIAFDYFGRPPLVIDGMFNTRKAFPSGVTAYSLGNPQWGLGTVTYAFTASTPSSACSGTITLQWFGLGWTEGTSSFSCLAS